ncbi:MAG TPA: DUF3857 domain-containing protein, partial [Phaeodactylibacter sp.]|nr:DUF3857 domain-containing protein [Phaeodactylibacter sp.]
MSHCSTLKTLLLVIGLLCFSSSIFSQTQKEPKFGKIKLSQLQKEKDDKFPDAHAVVLFDYGVSYYRYDAVSRTLKLNYERHTAIQFFDNTKFDLATFEIPLYHVSGHGETLRKIKAYTYNIVDGEMERTKFSKKDIVKEKITDYLDKKKFTLTNVKEGSIIEVKYSVASDFATYMKPWYFQRKVPVRYSEYNIDVPEFFIFNKSMSGYFAPYIKPVKKNSRNDYLMISQGWAMKNLPAFEEERYMRSYKNYISKIEFELRSIRYPWGEVENLIKSWEDIRDDLYRNGDFGKEIKKGKKVESIVEQFKEGSEKERMVAIYEYVKTHMKWNGRKSEMSYQGVKKSLEKAEGTSGDINILLAAALRKAGFKVTPVILSTRDNGMLPYAPTVRKINYMIVKVDIGDKTFYLDATDDFFPAGLLPIRCFNGNAIILGEKETKKVEVKPTFGKKFVTQNILNLEEDGVLKGVIKKTKSGYAALDFREEYSEATDEDAFVEDLQNKTEGLTIESHEIEN